MLKHLAHTLIIIIIIIIKLAHIWDLLPCDYHIFEALTKALESCTFTSYNDVLQAVAKWLRQQPNELFADQI
jgi:hypothetical protein